MLFSGDKLLGGPQAGIIAGRKEWIQKIEKDPLMRAFRLDKMTLAALEATLRLYLNEERALREVPVLRMLATPLEELRQRAESLAERLARQRPASPRSSDGRCRLRRRRFAAGSGDEDVGRRGRAGIRQRRGTGPAAADGDARRHGPFTRGQTGSRCPHDIRASRKRC